MELKEKDERINVFVRFKSMSSETDTWAKCATTIIDAVSDKEIMVHQRDRIPKKFTFDRVFGSSASQVEVYDVVVSPLLKQVIAGYNCTVFAYGQTGTGKTYTMQGDRLDDLNLHWRSDTSAGIIPRCCSQLFEELQLLGKQRYTMKVSFLELYKEELFDLLTSDSNVMPATKIRLYEDVTRKGSVIIHGLEEITIRNETEIYRILEKGLERRRTAATLLNDNSSRSHSVFSITIHTEGNIDDGEELLKMAKLNLVDLAGNEGIGKYGIFDKIGREAKSINQSLLTLGRVITALVEKASHVPYRESKLTRLLQDSLGGRTKTSIIATISSTGGNFDETLSTLDYACRAKNIINCPKINEVFYRKALLKEYTEEIERLKRDLAATRGRNGINLSLDDYDAMKTLIDRQRLEIKEKEDYCLVLEKVMRDKEEIFHDLRSQCDAQKYELAERTSTLEKMNRLLQSTKHTLLQVKNDTDEQKYLANRYVETEKILHGQAEIVLSVVKEASEDARKLHDKLGRQTKAQQKNEELGSQIKADFMRQGENIEHELSAHSEITHHFLQSIKDEAEACVATQIASTATAIRAILQDAIYQHFAASKKFKKAINASYTRYQEALNVHASMTMRQINKENGLLTSIYTELASNISNLSRYNESFVQNLQVLNENITQKLENASTYAKLAIETVCRNRLEECNYLEKGLKEISEEIANVSQNEKQVMENYKRFGKRMEDLSDEFDLLNKCESSYSENINTSHKVDQICNKMRDQTLQNYNADINKQKDLKHFLCVTQNGIKSDINDGINQTQVLNKTAIERRIIFVNDLQTSLNTGRVTLKRYDNIVQFHGAQLQQKMVKDKNTMLTSSANISKAIENMGFPYLRFLEQQQNKISDSSKRIDDKFTIQSVELNNWNNNMVEQLHTSQQWIDKFLVEDFCQDVSTGTTTPRKKFSYPRKFATMSLSEGAIQRFGEIRKNMDEMEEDLELAG